MALRFTSTARLLRPRQPPTQRSTSATSRPLSALSTDQRKCALTTNTSLRQTCAPRFTQSTHARKSFAEQARQWAILCTRPPRGHRYWGFTIYRSTYGDDIAWSQLMLFLHARTKKGVESWRAPELMDSLDLKVHENPTEFEGASKDEIRTHFKSWIQSAADLETVEHPNAVPILLRNRGTTARYQFCLHVDAEALYSIIDRESKMPKPFASIRGHINLISAEWSLPDEEDCAVRREVDDMEDPLDEDEEPLEGCRMYDVGWMKVRPVELLPHFYHKIESAWEYEYRRPPALVPSLGE